MHLFHPIVAVVILVCLAGCQVNHIQMASPIKGDSDPAHYGSLELENGMQVLLVSDSALTKAYGSVSVRAGYFQDPDSLPGLAHLYEHMLSKGTQKYPQPAAYKQFLADHGGRSNASTSALRTNYYFQVAGASFEGALERFAWQFIQPLIPQSLVYKERHAVEAEFRMKFKDAYRRKREVWRTAFAPEHPYRKFSTGNLSTLIDQPEISLSQALLDFGEDYYCAPRMALVMAAPLPLEQLRVMAGKYFSAVSSSCGETLSQAVSPYAEPPDGKVINVQALRKRSRLTLSFVVPDNLNTRRAMISDYISWLLEAHNPQGLEQHLKDKGWIKGLYVSQPVLDDRHRLFNLTLRFTAQGWKHQSEAMQITWQYLDTIKQQVSETHFNDTFARLHHAQFNQDASHKSSTEIRELADQLLFYPASEALVLNQIPGNYNSHATRAWLDGITAKNTLLIREHRNLAFDQSEPYYNTGFGYQQQLEAPQSSLQELMFELPALPRYFAMQEGELQTPEIGCRQPATGFESCVLPGQKRHSDYASINLYLDADRQRPAFFVLNPLYIRRLRHQLEPLITQADSAGMDVSLVETQSGWRLSVSGYSGDRVALLRDLSAILLSPQLDSTSMSLTLNSHRSALSQQAYQRLRDRTLQILNTKLGLDISTRDAQRYFENFSEHQYQDYIDRSFERARLTATYFGKLSVDERDVLDSLFTTMSRRIRFPVRPGSHAWNGKTEMGLHQVALDAEDNAVRLMVLPGSNKITQHAATELLGAMMTAPFFHQLRTQEQLGYSVSVKAYSKYGYPYLGYYVQSSRKTPSLLLARIEHFNQWFMTHLDSVTVVQFDTVKHSLIDALQQPYINAESEAQARRYHFRYDWADNHPQQLQQQIKLMSLDEFREHASLLLSGPLTGVLAKGTTGKDQ
ncbi:insulinase family protein [Lacimicrobium alkaliphilum]|uniref:Protease III n=1 Tax=Lacimicrobium alkaliphilum TaxID=1526571 RepID=A0ABQ1RL37_9ALTE|nr:insulinase family protein [Lacimicrobium alkaliphilum]GGD70583.1 protease III [Lacimicrobium alkaliphilum]